MNIKSMLSNAISTVWAGCKKKAPTLLTTAGLGLGAYTVYKVAKKAPEAKEKASTARKKASEEGLTPVQTKVAVAKAVLPVYAEPIATGVAAAGCIIASDVVANKRLTRTTGELASSVAMVGALQNRLKNYEETAEEVLGKNKAEDLKRKSYEKLMEKSEKKPEEAKVIASSDPNVPQLFYDTFIEDYYRSSVRDINKAINDINILVHNEYLDGGLEDYVGPNDFYSLIGLKTPKANEAWVFSSRKCFTCGDLGIEAVVGQTSVVAPNGESALVIDFTKNLALKDRDKLT